MVAKVRTGKPMLEEKVHVFWRSHHLYSSFWVVAPKRIHHEPSPLLKGLPSHKVRHSSPSLLKYRVSIACISLIPELRGQWLHDLHWPWQLCIHPAKPGFALAPSSFPNPVLLSIMTLSLPAPDESLVLSAYAFQINRSFSIDLSTLWFQTHAKPPFRMSQISAPLHPSQITAVSPLGMQTPSGQASVYHGPVHNLQCLELC